MQTKPNTVSRQRAIHFLPALLFALGTALLAGPSHAGAREAVTLWWVIFNNPAECENGCDGEDLANAAAEPSVVYATGQITRSSGRVQLVASLYEQSRRYVDELFAGPGLKDAEKAEIHLVVRSHGARRSKHRLQQITQFLDPSCEELGGRNDCRDIQFAVHLPGEDYSESAVIWFPDLTKEGAIPGAKSRLFRDQQGVKVVLETETR